MEEPQVSSDKTEVRAALGRLGGERRFIVQNVGAVSAFDVQLTVESTGGKNPPLVAGEHEKKFPVRELPAGSSESLLAIITTGTGIHFRGVVSWRNPDGSRDEKVFDLSA